MVLCPGNLTKKEQWTDDEPGGVFISNTVSNFGKAQVAQAGSCSWWASRCMARGAWRPNIVAARVLHHWSMRSFRKHTRRTRKKGVDERQQNRVEDVRCFVFHQKSLESRVYMHLPCTLYIQQVQTRIWDSYDIRTCIHRNTLECNLDVMTIYIIHCVCVCCTRTMHMMHMHAYLQLWDIQQRCAHTCKLMPFRKLFCPKQFFFFIAA